ncbi:MAG TPA: tRNA glutamyl-Q(34) synthetase GluQRS [Pararhizobium sp.]|nr:tRNA glutamyl-Q(34) synthetase GluQRS [Pararhizobium sp.]
MPSPVFRFAPSPNGLLHLGHALSAIINFDMAGAAGGRFLLRIEDIDITRCQPEFERQIYEDLAWLGLEWEKPVRRQSAHFGDYRAALEVLIDAGLVYPAFGTRGETRAAVTAAEAGGKPWPHDPDGAPFYAGNERDLGLEARRRLIETGAPFAWRLDMEKALAHAGQPIFWEESGAGPDGEAGTITADPARWGDVVLARKDVPTGYHLAVTVDDALQGITHVVRGRDLFHATSVHRLLQVLLGLPAPSYHHHRLVLGDDGLKLSKSRGDTALAALRAAGVTAADVRRLVEL